MKEYRIITAFETIYTHEKETKIEYTTDRDSAIRTFGIYIANPEVRFCSIDIPKTKEGIVIDKMIASYKHE